MLHKCLNPVCNAQFRYMYEGRLLHLRRVEKPRDAMDALLRRRREPGEFFWLCHNCAEKFQVIRAADGFALVPMHEAADPIATAS